jgi:hypothetical protein
LIRIGLSLTEVRNILAGEFDGFHTFLETDVEFLD